MVVMATTTRIPPIKANSLRRVRGGVFSQDLGSLSRVAGGSRGYVTVSSSCASDREIIRPSGSLNLRCLGGSSGSTRRAYRAVAAEDVKLRDVQQRGASKSSRGAMEWQAGGHGR